MPRLTDDAIVLRVWEFSETSQTVSLLSRSAGVIRGLAKGARREKSAFSGGFEPATIGQISAITKESEGLANLTEWALAWVSPAVRRSLSAHRTALYAVDLAHHALVEQDPHPKLYDALASLLRQLDHPKHANALLMYQLALLREVGYGPNLSQAQRIQANTQRTAPVSIYAFHPAMGTLDPVPQGEHAQPHAKTGWMVRAATAGALCAADQLLENNQQDRVFHDEAMSRGAVDRANRLLGSYIAYVLRRDVSSRQPLLGPLAPGVASSHRRKPAGP